jgi:hypothetical protein
VRNEIICQDVEKTLCLILSKILFERSEYVENISENCCKIVVTDMMRKPKEKIIQPQGRKRHGIPRNRWVSYKN